MNCLVCQEPISAKAAKARQQGEFIKGQNRRLNCSRAHRGSLVAGFAWACIQWCNIDLTLFELPICRRTAIHLIGRVVSLQSWDGSSLPPARRGAASWN